MDATSFARGWTNQRLKKVYLDLALTVNNKGSIRKKWYHVWDPTDQRSVRQKTLKKVISAFERNVHHLIYYTFWKYKTNEPTFMDAASGMPNDAGECGIKISGPVYPRKSSMVIC